MSRQIVICVQRRYPPNPVCCANNGSRELVPKIYTALSFMTTTAGFIWVSLAILNFS